MLSSTDDVTILPAVSRHYSALQGIYLYKSRLLLSFGLGENQRSNPTALQSLYQFQALVTDDMFGENPGLYSRIHPVAQMDVMEEVQFKLPPLTPTENSWYSNSSEEYSYTDGFYEILHQCSVNSSSLNISSPSAQSLSANSAFTAYVQGDPKAGLDISSGGHILHKRCFKFFGLIQEKRESETQMSTATAPAGNHSNQHQKSKIDLRNKSAFEHMIAERNRRIRLKQHFSNLYSFLPKHSKRDKHSILANTESYLRELKLRLAELEQQNENLLKLIPEDNNEGSSRFESPLRQANSEGNFFYRSDDVTLEQCEDNPCQVKISIRAQRDLIRCPTALLTKLLEQLSVEQLQLVSIHCPTQALWFHAAILIEPKGEGWNAPKWKKFGEVVRRFVASNYHKQLI
ncbi:uncharacterized protein LOC131027459 [Cryptomeria japonica]|uniref:uncharacterized protein LOC131027459 n=1 Tax=Cryptomeria japonica TaxID=3369 RepID=UPI0027DA7311|nr:uncharacterized protein LOC131027459 [Cryptomeria japonica]